MGIREDCPGSPDARLSRQPSNLLPTPSYTQPAGAGAARRGRERSHTVGTESDHGPPGVRRYVFCDVVMDLEQVQMQHGDDGCETPPAGDVHAFVMALGNEIDIRTRAARPKSIRMATPGKVPKVDLRKVAHHLRELHSTELSYYRKIHALYKNFAAPLRLFAKNSATELINKYDALRLFGNLELLVPISEGFLVDLQDLVQELDSDPDQVHIPARVGEVILRNVKKMAPYRDWLANVSQAESIYKRTLASNSRFADYEERHNQICRTESMSTGGLRELLAEPFQRVSRYRLMIDPIRDHLPQTDESISHLHEAIRQIDDICAMEIDESTQRAITFWAFNQIISDFPPGMMARDRAFVSCLDVLETYDVDGSPEKPLRCSLFLFNDKLLIAKRPSGTKGARQLCGLDDMDNLAALYQDPSKGTTSGTPRKLKKAEMGYRGVVELDEVTPVDLGGEAFGLVFARAPFDGQGRWSGRLVRRYTVAPTYPVDIRRVEKETFLGQLAERRCVFAGRTGGLPRKSARIWEGGMAKDSFIIYYSLWERPLWERDVHERRTKLAIQLDGTAGRASDLICSGPKVPLIIARADFLEGNKCHFTARVTDGNTGASSEVIGRDRIPGALEALAQAYGLFDLPHVQPRTPRSPGGSVKMRPRSFYGNTLDIFSGGKGLQRENTTASKASTATTTSRVSGQSSTSGSPQAFASPGRTLDHRRSGSMSPGWYAKGGVDLGSTSMDTSGASDTEDEDGMEVLRTCRASTTSPGSFLAPPDARGRRRSSSLPPPPPAELQHSSEPARLSMSHGPELELRLLDEPSYQCPTPDRPATRQVSRRLMGPRQPGEAPRDVSGSRSQSPVPPSHPTSSMPTYLDQQMSASLPTPSPFARPDERSPATSPFARGHSPSPIPFARDHSPTPFKLASGQQLDTPPQFRSATTSPPSSKRALAPEASPRASPAKKLAQVSDAGPRRPSPTASRSDVRPRMPSGSSVAGRRKGRVASGASVNTIRALSPGVPSGRSSPIRSRDVFDDATELERRPFAAPASPSKSVDPFDKVREHVLDLRLKLSRQISNAVVLTKENAPLSTPGTAGISRSPHTRNLKANTAMSSVLMDPPTPARPLDAAAMLRWADRLGTLLENASSNVVLRVREAEEMSDVNGPREAEFETLNAERDLLADELAAVQRALKERELEAEQLKEENGQLATSLVATQEQNGILRDLYGEMCATVQEAYTGYQDELGNLSNLIKENVPDDQKDLVDQLEQALLEKRTAQLDLEQCQRDHRFALQEMEGRLAMFAED